VLSEQYAILDECTSGVTLEVEKKMYVGLLRDPFLCEVAG
jgi:ABC-type uncharacterized transport system fused permease/ATPase subunit